MGGRVGRKVGGVVVQYLVLTMVVDIRPWIGEVQGWWQVRRGLSYVRLFVDVSALEDVISERVKVTSAWTEGFVSWFKEWESKFAFACWDKYSGW